ncbi:uncharacterized protein [Diadema setosum]|uniref:uncharacterized protein n=1 Tax=Diadema setosum TaxID=31175 RepID=UPI003B3B3F84
MAPSLHERIQQQARKLQLVYARLRAREKTRERQNLQDTQKQPVQKPTRHQYGQGREHRRWQKIVNMRKMQNIRQQYLHRLQNTLHSRAYDGSRSPTQSDIEMYSLSDLSIGGTTSTVSSTTTSATLQTSATGIQTTEQFTTPSHVSTTPDSYQAMTNRERMRNDRLRYQSMRSRLHRPGARSPLQSDRESSDQDAGTRPSHGRLHDQPMNSNTQEDEASVLQLDPRAREDMRRPINDNVPRGTLNGSPEYDTIAVLPNGPAVDYGNLNPSAANSLSIARNEEHLISPEGHTTLSVMANEEARTSQNDALGLEESILRISPSDHHHSNVTIGDIPSDTWGEAIEDNDGGRQNPDFTVSSVDQTMHRLPNEYNYDTDYGDDTISSVVEEERRAAVSADTFPDTRIDDPDLSESTADDETVNEVLSVDRRKRARPRILRALRPGLDEWKNRRDGTFTATMESSLDEYYNDIYSDHQEERNSNSETGIPQEYRQVIMEEGFLYGSAAAQVYPGAYAETHESAARQTVGESPHGERVISASTRIDPTDEDGTGDGHQLNSGRLQANSDRDDDWARNLNSIYNDRRVGQSTSSVQYSRISHGTSAQTVHGDSLPSARTDTEHRSFAPSSQIGGYNDVFLRDYARRFSVRGGHDAGPVAWGAWRDWSLCSRSCGHDGIKTRVRLCHSPALGVCRGVNSVQKQEIRCTLERCPDSWDEDEAPGDHSLQPWSHWSDWSPCSPSCGIGRQQRMRSCLVGFDDGRTSACDGSSLQIQICHNTECDNFGRASRDFDDRHVTRIKCHVDGTRAQLPLELFWTGPTGEKITHAMARQSSRYRIEGDTLIVYDSHLSEGSYNCHVVYGSRGDRSEATGSCRSHPCHRHGVCLDRPSKDGTPYTCLCAVGYEGLRCHMSAYLEGDVILFSLMGWFVVTSLIILVVIGVCCNKRIKKLKMKRELELNDAPAEKLLAKVVPIDTTHDIESDVEETTSLLPKVDIKSNVGGVKASSKKHEESQKGELKKRDSVDSDSAAKTQQLLAKAAANKVKAVIAFQRMKTRKKHSNQNNSNKVDISSDESDTDLQSELQKIQHLTTQLSCESPQRNNNNIVCMKSWECDHDFANLSYQNINESFDISFESYDNSRVSEDLNTSSIIGQDDSLFEISTEDYRNFRVANAFSAFRGSPASPANPAIIEAVASPKIHMLCQLENVKEYPHLHSERGVTYSSGDLTQESFTAEFDRQWQGRPVCSTPPRRNFGARLRLPPTPSPSMSPSRPQLVVNADRSRTQTLGDEDVILDRYHEQKETYSPSPRRTPTFFMNGASPADRRSIGVNDSVCLGDASQSEQIGDTRGVSATTAEVRQSELETDSWEDCVYYDFSTDQIEKIGARMSDS